VSMSKARETQQDLVQKRERFLAGVKRLGTISAGAREAGVARKTARRWLEEEPDFREAYEEALAEFRDSIEERLVNRIDTGGNGATLRFKGKGELPEKYRVTPRAATGGEKPALDWEALERAEEARDQGEPAAGAGDDGPCIEEGEGS